MQRVVALEREMRISDVDKALDQVRANLAATYGLKQHLKKATTQHHKLRNRAPARRLRAAVTAAANVYRRARVALVHLGMREDDEKYRPLRRCAKERTPPTRGGPRTGPSLW